MPGTRRFSIANAAAPNVSALGVAATAGALAFIAVFAKSTGTRLAASEPWRVALVVRVFEFAAELTVLVFGLVLIFGARGGA
jgi:hypothetical protein